MTEQNVAVTKDQSGVFPITLTSKEFTRVMRQIGVLRAENSQLRSENKELRSRAATAEKKARTYAGIIRETAAKKK
jgi:regulator of replication initiation timing